MIEHEPFTGPRGTLFLLGPEDILITTWEGGEATVPREDLVAFLRFCYEGGFETLEVLARPLSSPKAIEDV